MHVRPSEITDWIRTRAVTAGARGLAVPLDGGLDSSVVAGLCQRALPDRVAALVIAPTSGDRTAADADAHAVAEHLGIPVVVPDLQLLQARMDAVLHGILRQLPAPGPPGPAAGDASVRHAGANFDVRLRTAFLYFVADTLNYLVAGALNRCDLTAGLFIRHGDGAADIFPLGGLLSSDVRALAQDLHLPDRVLQKPTWVRSGPPDEDDGAVRFTYEDLERYLGDGPDAVAPATALRIERLIRSTAHKRLSLLTPDSEI